MTLYKALTKDNKGPYSDFDFTPYLPHGKRPGKWLPKCDTLKICASGWHGCEGGDIIEFLNANIYEIETRGEVEKDDNKFTSQQIRLIRKCGGWDDVATRLFACDCADRVLPFFEKEHPEDKRPRQAIETARKFANGKASNDELAAAWDAAGDAAWDAAWDAAGAAARAAAWDAARDAARAAAGAAAWAAAWDAAGDAAGAAARAAARDAEKKWQIKKLLKILATHPEEE